VNVTITVEVQGGRVRLLYVEIVGSVVDGRRRPAGVLFPSGRRNTHRDTLLGNVPSLAHT
jgi:hypothetical protein